MPIGILTLHLHLLGCASLKEKRGRIKPILARLHNRLNLSAAEMDRLDMWHEAVIVCAAVGNQKDHVSRVLQEAVSQLEKHGPNVDILDHRIEFI